MNIVILDGYTLNPGDLSWAGIEKLGSLKVYDRTAYDLDGEYKVIERIEDADIVLTNKTPITRGAIEKAKKLKYIGVLATGYNVVDIEVANERGIVVTNIPTYGTAAVAQMTIALLLEVCHHVGHHSEEVKRGAWTANKDWCFWNYPLIELADKTIGIIGYGRIGAAVGRISQALGMKVLSYDRSPDRSLENDLLKFVELEELLEKSDVISLHCPLFDSTRGIINKESIKRMKDGVIILNTSRGPLIVENELADALNCGKVAAAAIDVVSAEPIKEDNPLLTAKNCIITPHIAWAPIEARRRLMDIAVENLKSFLEGTPVNVVNI